MFILYVTLPSELFDPR